MRHGIDAVLCCLCPTGSSEVANHFQTVVARLLDGGLDEWTIQVGVQLDVIDTLLRLAPDDGAYLLFRRHELGERPEAAGPIDQPSRRPHEMRCVALERRYDCCRSTDPLRLPRTAPLHADT